MRFLTVAVMLGHALATKQVLEGDYEYIVVGAGSAGSVVAGELARQGAQVLLLEAGGDNHEPAIGDLKQYYNVAYNDYNYGFLHWGFESTPQVMQGGHPSDATQQGDDSGRVLKLPQGKVLGGTHSLNGAAYSQAHADDFDRLAKELGDPMWQWKETESLRFRLEQTLGVINLGTDQVGFADWVQTANETLGLPYNSNLNNGKQYGIGTPSWTGMETPRGGQRTTSYDAFVEPYKARSYTTDCSLSDQEQCARKQSGSIQVITFHHAQRLIYDPQDPSSAVGIRCLNVRTNLEVDFFATRDIIISAGTYNSPALLMRSGIGAQQQLEGHGIPVHLDLPGVGQNLRDHYAISTFWKLENLPQDTPFLFQSPSMNLFGPESVGPPKFQLETSGNYASCAPLRQESVGSVRLRSNATLDTLLIDPNAMSTTQDLDDMIQCLREMLIPFLQGLVTKGLVSPINLDLDATDQELRAFILENVASNHHPVGTCQIGQRSSPGNIEDGSVVVVNNDFVVHGMSNVRVIDASIFPRVPSGNVLAPVLTLGMLGAQKILQQSPHGVMPKTTPA